MNSSPEHEPDHPQDWPQDHAGEPRAPSDRSSSLGWEPVPPAEPPFAASEPTPGYSPEPWPLASESTLPVPSFLQVAVQPPPPVRIPHFGHLLFLLLALTPMGLLATGVLMAIAMRDHLFGIASAQKAVTDIHYILGSEGLLYLFTFAACLLIFPLFWHKSLFAGLQWNGATALRLRWRLVSAAIVCFLLAVVNGEFMPGPTNTPIEKVFRSPGAAWLLFAFGVTFAPFFEETLFRGFLLPSLCTAYDWFAEKTTGEPVRPLGENGHPQWSFSAMFVASIATSIPFAWMHAAQTGYSVGPFLLLVGVSLVLCLVRLSTRSLASSVLVHACYNFMLFSLMLIGTGGFRHLDKM